MGKNKNKEKIIVTISYSFDDEVVAIIFDNYKKACNFIKEDFENEKRIDTEENGYKIDEENTYCENSKAVLATCYNDEIGITTWTIATVIKEKDLK